MPGEPVVSVVLCVYNDEQFLGDALESVLSQTFPDFELISIDDGSTDSSGTRLISINDPRVRVIRNEHNLGLTRSLNIGLDAARGKYIARMDADDICEPDRFLQQVEFLNAHAEVGILGTSRQVIDENGNNLHIARATETDVALRWRCLLGNPFAHPTVMLRKSVLDQHHLRYDESFRTSQDYELWTRLLQHTHGENLSEPLLRYRLRDGMSRLSRAEQLANHDRIAHAACTRLLPAFPLSLEQVHQLRGRFGGMSVREPEMDASDPEWVRTYEQMRGAFAEREWESGDAASKQVV